MLQHWRITLFSNHEIFLGTTKSTVLVALDRLSRNPWKGLSEAKESPLHGNHLRRPGPL